MKGFQFFILEVFGYKWTRDFLEMYTLFQESRLKFERSMWEYKTKN